MQTKLQIEIVFNDVNDDPAHLTDIIVDHIFEHKMVTGESTVRTIRLLGAKASQVVG